MAAYLSWGGRSVTVGRVIFGDTGGFSAFIPSYIGWGKGVNGSAADSSDLQTPSNEARVVVTASRQSSGTNGGQARLDIAQFVGLLTSASAQTITEVGVFVAAGTGTPPTGAVMYFYGTFSGVTLAIGDSIQFTVSVQYV